MFVKLKNGNPDQFPYTVGQLRRDNPNTSFPKAITEEFLEKFDVFKVIGLAEPEFDPLVQNVVRNDLPHKENRKIGMDENGQPMYGDVWVVGFTVQNKPQAIAENCVRKKRDELLKETDWTQLGDAPFSLQTMEAWQTYRQALRDITKQDGFPFNVTFPTPPGNPVEGDK